MSVANSLISVSVDSQAALIATLTSQVAALTTSVGANTTAVSANATQISSLVAVTAQAVTNASIADTGYIYANQEVVDIFDDPVVPGNYAFRISGVFASATGANNTAVLELANTAAGATYNLEFAGALKDTSVSYTGFFTFANGGPNPKISIKYITGDSTNWGWTNVSLVFYRLSTAPGP